MKLKTVTTCSAAAWFVLGSAGLEAAVQSAQPAAPAGAATPAAGQAPAAAPADPFAGLPAAHPEDVSSIDAIVKAIYGVISGDAGVKRDWQRFRSLFYPGARMAPSGINQSTGKAVMRYMSPDDYVKTSGPFLEKEGFHEQELVRHVDAYGNIAQIFTSYAARHKITDEKPFMRGINSIQLFNDGTRWWVTSIAWSPENAKHPLPAAFEKAAR